MPTANAILADLRKKGSEKTRITYARHGMTPDRLLGVSVADLKVIAKTIKGQQALAMDLYATGFMEAMYLAGIVANGSKMSREELERWAEGAAGLQMVAEYTVPWVAIEHPKGRETALAWMGSTKEHIATAGWVTYTGIIATSPDETLNLPEIEGLLAKIVKEINAAPNRVRLAMNSFVIAVGSHVKPLLEKAKATARKVGAVIVDMGNTACKVPDAIPYIEKAETSGKVGAKRKTMRC
jgi:3-methyladenine DNA glycosylase AlkD